MFNWYYQNFNGITFQKILKTNNYCFRGNQ